MKKIISIIIAAVMAFCLCLPAFAAQSATFAVNVVSEDSKSAVVSIDYEGGAAFNCLDFEVKLSKRVSVEKATNGAGLRNFQIYAQDNFASNGVVISSFNKDINPMMFTYVSLVGFKAVNGKDLIVLTLKKSSSGKLTSDDIKLNVTNCGINGSGESDVIIIGAKAVQIGGSSTVKTSAAAGQAGTAVDKTNASVRTTTTSSVTTTAADSSELSAESTTPVAESASDKNNETTGTKTTDKKKIVIVGAAALIVLAGIVVGVVVIAKKYKKEDAE